eukprot:scaffold1284_cov108-Cylindrotheca_fusiformis.AAC.30
MSSWGAGLTIAHSSSIPALSFEEVPLVSLRAGKQVQVETKIVDYYELSHGQRPSMKESWHVEGMSHKEIVTTVIYFIDGDDKIESGNIFYSNGLFT